jgi:RNase P/RNase MRP subunit POP5
MDGLGIQARSFISNEPAPSDPTVVDFEEQLGIIGTEREELTEIWGALCLTHPAQDSS